MQGLFRRAVGGMMVAGFLALAPMARGQDQGNQGGGPGGALNVLLTPPVSQGDLDAIEQRLGFTDEQRRGAKLKFGVYASAFGDKAAAMRQEQDRLRQDFRDSRDPDVLRELRDKVAAFAKERAAAEAGLMGELHGLLTPEQEAAWPGVERMRRRETLGRPGVVVTVAGERVDLFKIVDRLKLSEASTKAIAEAMNDYEMELDRALVARNAVQDKAGTQREMLIEAFRNGDVSKLMPAWEESRNAVYRLRDVNMAAQRRIAALLPAEDAARFDDAVRRAAYPQIYRLARPAQGVIAAAEGFKDLDAQQQQGLAAIKERYAADSLALDKREQGAWDAVERELSPKKLIDQFAQRAAGGGGPGGGGPPGMGEMMDEARQHRQELEARTAASVRAILSEEQKGRLPEEGAGD